MPKASLRIVKKPLTEKQALRRKAQIEAKIGKLSAKLVSLFS